MHLARHSISDTAPTQIIDTRFDAECRIFTCSTPTGFAIYQTWPLKLLRKHDLKNGTISLILPLHTSSVLFLLGGGRSPLYAPNKVIVWDEAKAREAAELEFRERVRGISCRRGWLSVALKRRVVIFQIGEQGIRKYGEWETYDNPRGLVSMATSPNSTVVVIPGLQLGHVQLIHLPPCPPPPLSITTSPTQRPSLLAPVPRYPRKHSVSIVVAHTTPLTTLTVASSGSLIATTSTRGTLVRIWDSYSGKLMRELRRGADQAEIYGVAFRPDEQEVCVWSDKGTVHVFSLGDSKGSSNRTSALSSLSPFLKLPKYFESEWSYCHYRLPSPTSHLMSANSNKIAIDPDAGDEEKCMVGWVRESADASELESPQYQLVALTYSGGWYRLSLPSVSKSGDNEILSRGNSSRSSRPTSKGKEREQPREKEIGRTCSLQEFKRFGRWDGWA